MEKKLVFPLSFTCCFFSASIPVMAQKQHQPNIILIVADDHGTDALGCYGNPIIKTPALDALATDGIRFTNAFCTSASSSPSRSVILTGLHNHTNGMYGLAHEFSHFSSFENIKSLPVYLSESGYQTFRIGKFHLAPEEVYKFDIVLSEEVVNDNNALGRSPIEMADKCESVFQNKNKPFFLYFALDDPHRDLPFETWPSPNSFGNRKEAYPGEKMTKYNPDSVLVPYFLPDIPECREELAQYYQSVSRLDQGVAKLIGLLKKSGKYDDTFIIYISDNGIAFPGAKTTLYESGIRLPCIVKLPDQKHRGTVINAMISWVDITPTILDCAAALPPKSAFQGKSFKTILESAKTHGWDEVYASHTFHTITMYYPMRMVRTRKYKLIWNIAHELDFPFAKDLIGSTTWKGILAEKLTHIGKLEIKTFIKRDEFELFNLENDPEELVNLSNNPQYAGILEELKVKIKDFQKRTSDPWLYKWEYE